MEVKWRFHLLGWITLLVFPAPALWALWHFEGIPPLELLELDKLFTPLTLIGLELGLFYALLILAISQFSIFQEMSKLQERMLKSLKLSWFDIVFMSLCAGIGEEILFRVGIQFWVGPFWTSILFIALHGYFNPLSLKKSIYGFVLLPFILILAYGYEYFGLWFVIAAHFSYDLLLFSFIRK